MKKKIYKIKVTVDTETQSMNVKRFNKGFNAYEVLGMLEQFKQDVLKQISGEIKPDEVKRTIVTNK